MTTQAAATKGNEGRVAIIAWGSLIWDQDHPRAPEFNKRHDAWQKGGPTLPIEFSRVSTQYPRKGLLTLVIDPKNGTPVPTQFSFSKRRRVDAAAKDLRKREHTKIKDIGFVNLDTNQSRSGNDDVKESIREWASGLGLRGVVWTDLPPNFLEKLSKEFSDQNALNYLHARTGESLSEAIKYIRNAPDEIETRFRRFLRKDPWFQKQEAADREAAIRSSVSQEAQPMKEYARDSQTGEVYELHHEEWPDVVAASLSVIYLLAMLLILAWQLFDIWISNYWLPKAAGYKDFIGVNTPTFRLIAFVAIGGALGGVVNGLRSFIAWHAQRQAFGRRFLWKDIALPPLGATLAVIVYALVRGGVAAFSGSTTLGDGNAVSSLTALATGALAGYGSHKIFIWLDLQVNRLFSAPSGADIRVPNLIGKRREDAEKLLQDANLSLGKVKNEPHDDVNKVDTIINQDPAADSMVPEGVPVDVTIATAPSGNRQAERPDKSNAGAHTAPTAAPSPTSTSPPAAPKTGATP